MSKFIKLPDSLKEWKINSLISDENGNKLYSVSKKDYNGNITSALLRHIYCYDQDYTDENIEYLIEETNFLQSVVSLKNATNYIDIVSSNNEKKDKFDIYLLTEDFTSFNELMKTKAFLDDEIVDFGIQISNILETLEKHNIFHGNLSPSNIYVDKNNNYVVGGFSDFESKISDLSYIAPEISRKDVADYTTDIYSLGLIMYCLSNNKKLPFEMETGNIELANTKRLDGATIAPPENGNEKLKSVIIIACQVSNKNRWKNAGNIKNALVSIQKELPKAPKPKVAPVVAQTDTNFGGNVFDEFEYFEPETEEPTLIEEPVEQPVEEPVQEQIEEATEEQVEQPVEEPVETQVEQPIEDTITESVEPVKSSPDEETIQANINSEKEFETIDSSSNQDANVLLSELENKENSVSPIANNDSQANVDKVKSDTTPIKNNSQNISSDDITDDVFDSYSANKPQEKLETNKNYGQFFDEPNEKVQQKDVDNFEQLKEEEKIEEETENNLSDTDNKNKKKNGVVIAISCIVIAAALGFIGFCIVTGINKNNDNSNTTTSSTSSTVATQVATTQQPTTVEPTTEEPTTISTQQEVMQVVGLGYSYGKELLEAQGFEVAIGEYKYSDIYDAGYVISQNPVGGTTSQSGAIITLDVSLGKAEPETTVSNVSADNSSKASSSKANSSKASSSKVSSSKPSSSSTTSSKKDSSYIFANSNSSYLSKKELTSLSRNNLNLALNEIYARRGLIFSDSSLSSYFNAKTWYTPKYYTTQFSANVTFNKYEQANLQLMIQVQKDKGYR